jgi:hypothetical protein
VSKLDENFFPMDIQVIKSIPPGTTVIFGPGISRKNGVFSVKSAYRTLVSTKRVRED